jgi:hypothetical protein
MEVSSFFFNKHEDEVSPSICDEDGEKLLSITK